MTEQQYRELQESITDLIKNPIRVGVRDFLRTRAELTKGEALVEELTDTINYSNIELMEKLDLAKEVYKQRGRNQEIREQIEQIPFQAYQSSIEGMAYVNSKANKIIKRRIYYFFEQMEKDYKERRIR